jgi:hypothetical protein
VSGVLKVVSGGLDGSLIEFIAVTLNFTSTSMSSLRLISSAASKRHLKLLPQSWRTYATPTTFKPQEKDPQLGDYPDLPWISNQELPARGWWDQQMRRNFGDPVSTLPSSRRVIASQTLPFFRYKNTMKFCPCGSLILPQFLHIKLCSSFLSLSRRSLALVSYASTRSFQRDQPYHGNTRIPVLYVNLADLKKIR